LVIDNIPEISIDLRKLTYDDRLYYDIKTLNENPGQDNLNIFVEKYAKNLHLKYINTKFPVKWTNGHKLLLKKKIQKL